MVSVFQAVFLDVVDHILQSFCKFLEIFLIKENLVFIVSETSIGTDFPLAFGNSQIIIIPFRRFDVKEIGTLSSPDRFRENVLALSFLGAQFMNI